MSFYTITDSEKSNLQATPPQQSPPLPDGGRAMGEGTGVRVRAGGAPKAQTFRPRNNPSPPSVRLRADVRPRPPPPRGHDQPGLPEEPRRLRDHARRAGAPGL